MRHHRTPVGCLYVALCAIALSACGGAPPPPAEPTPEPALRKSRGPKMQMQSELGSIDQAEVEKVLQKAQGKLQECHKRGLKHTDYLAGDVKIFLRISEQGRVKYAYLEESTLGDRDTERCMLTALEAQAWPAPEGGEAEVRKGLGFDAPGDVRAPTSWPSDKIVQALGKAEDELHKCRHGVSGTFKATVYVEPDGKHGKVHAVGVTPPNKDGSDKVDCMVRALKSMKVPSPGSYAAKVTFSL